ncbi:2Fe-2S iron-sulfur cluster-binding protein [Streptomyces coffeae]|uniref:2Fe-2S iron-sulfur cluster binding domain-containing protein n=1 Tax=Streptomyces coffeae TaxID=621382 RepID=A0ABS1NEM0_9ACTN|nr:2Fe-2S iron-sulfur cluster-binding protein [Streptomyces coffeae]MBL1098523.1 2Fe-2S iron-sulfur cluster binding domain-containing protein [Streptomyces coffeae]
MTRRATGWHRLRVGSVEPLTDDAVAVSLEVPEALAGVFAHRPGQHVTVRHVLDGRELRRSYSVCPPPPPGACDGLRLVVKRLGPGGFAEYATRDLAAGDLLELAPPTGDFRLATRRGAHHVLIAAGSGITPLLSMAQAALRDDRACRVSLVHANRTARSVLLADELADLKDAHPGRFFVLHVLSRETRETDLLSGRIDTDRLPRLLALLGAEPGDDTHFYLCGPWGLVEEGRAALAAWGADPERVRFELFSTGTAFPEDGPDGPARRSAGTAGRITARLGGRTTVTTMEPGDRAVLDALLRARPETPYSCRDGLCGSCRAKVTGGRVTLGRQYALGADELAAGYTLACRALPESDDIEFDFDA